jgi:rhodanese-related sulfurtransferase
MTRTFVGILLIALIGQAAGAIDGSIRHVRISAAPSAAVNPGDESGPESGLPFFLNIPQAQALFEAGETIFADARPLDQFEEAHISGAEHLDPDAFVEGEDPDFVYTYPYEQRIVIYCQGGECDASELVAIRLQEFGFMNVHILQPGYPGWVEAGQPTEVGKP